MSSSGRIIKKYPNRRLYDTEESRYIAMEDLKKLVLNRVIFKVIDSRDSRDLTRSVLLQIISEEEEQQGIPLFSSEFLTSIIRFYGNSFQALLGAYLERSFLLFLEQQEEIQDRIQGMMPGLPFNPLDFMSEMSMHNASLWEAWSQTLFPDLRKIQEEQKNNQEHKKES